MNPVRCAFLRATLCDTFGRDARARAPLAGLHLLDVGCGGGLLAESLARMGAHVTGVDVSQGGLATAEAHARLDPALAGRLDYRAATVEQLAADGEVFDAGEWAGGYGGGLGSRARCSVRSAREGQQPPAQLCPSLPRHPTPAVIASEVIEHVASLPSFCAALGALARPGSGVAVSTLNRTPRSYALAIVAAEHVLRWVPPGTHDWTRFVTPEELALQMEESTGGGSSAEAAGSQAGAHGALRLQLLAGMQYNPLTGGWSLGRDTGVNYIAWFGRQG